MQECRVINICAFLHIKNTEHMFYTQIRRAATHRAPSNYVCYCYVLCIIIVVCYYVLYIIMCYVILLLLLLMCYYVLYVIMCCYYSICCHCLCVVMCLYLLLYVIDDVLLVMCLLWRVRDWCACLMKGLSYQTYPKTFYRLEPPGVFRDF